MNNRSADAGPARWPAMADARAFASRQQNACPHFPRASARRHPRLPDAESYRAFYAAKNPGIGIRDGFAIIAKAASRRTRIAAALCIQFLMTIWQPILTARLMKRRATAGPTPAWTRRVLGPSLCVASTRRGGKTTRHAEADAGASSLRSGRPATAFRAALQPAGRAPARWQACTAGTRGFYQAKTG